MLNGKKIRIIVATSSHRDDEGYVIGNSGDIPWKGLVHSDMVRFKELTTKRGKNSVLMGRKTWDSLDQKWKPLPRRQNIILTRDRAFKVDLPDVIVSHSLSEAVSLASASTVWIIGGAEIYNLTLDIADSIYRTIVYGRFRGNTFFPHIHRRHWEMTHFKDFRSGKAGTEKDKIDSGFMIFERK